LPGDVLSIEGLGSGLSTTLPARIVRWVTPLTSKRTPPARAAKQLVPARPLAFGFALLRRACIWMTENQALLTFDLLKPPVQPEKTDLTVLREPQRSLKPACLKDAALTQARPTRGSRSAPLARGRAARADACKALASRATVGALAASEAGRTARADVAHVRHAIALNDFGKTLCNTRCLTFEMRGGARLAG